MKGNKKIISIMLLIIILISNTFMGCGKKDEYESKLKDTVKLMKESTTQLKFALNAYSVGWDKSIKGNYTIGEIAKDMDVAPATVRDSINTRFKGDNTFYDKQTKTDCIPKGKFEAFIQVAYDCLEGRDKTITNLKEKDSTISESLKSINNPEEEYKEAYNTTLEIYENYSKMYSLVMNPKGSLMTFNQEVNSLNSQIDSKFNLFDIKCP